VAVPLRSPFLAQSPGSSGSNKHSQRVTSDLFSNIAFDNSFNRRAWIFTDSIQTLPHFGLKGASDLAGPLVSTFRYWERRVKSTRAFDTDRALPNSARSRQQSRTPWQRPVPWRGNSLWFPGAAATPSTTTIGALGLRSLRDLTHQQPHAKTISTSSNPGPSIPTAKPDSRAP
jgi:hypothetical protein